MSRVPLVAAVFAALACRSTAHTPVRAPASGVRAVHVDGGAPLDAAVRVALDAPPAPDSAVPSPFEVVGVAPAPGRCRGLTSLPLTSRDVDVLQGRLRARLPNGAVRSLPTPNATADNRNVRYSVRRGAFSMHIDLQDRFRHEAGSLNTALERFAHGLPSRAWTTPRGLRAIAVMPRIGIDRDVENPRAPGVNVLRAWVAAPDGMLFTAFFFVEGPLNRTDMGCAAQAMSIVDALSAGERALDTRATAFHPIVGWTLDVPDGWARGVTNFADHVTVEFERTTGILGPTLRMHFQLGSSVVQEPNDWSIVPGTIDRLPVVWREIDNGAWHVRETLFAPPGSQSRAVIRYESTTPEGYREVDAVLRTLRRDAR